MTVTTTANKIVFQGNGATTVFPFTFPGVGSMDIQVFYTDALGNITLLATTAYTLSLNAPAGTNPTGTGGSVTYNPSGTPIPLGTSLTILRTLPETQSTSLANQGNLWQPVVEAALDYQTMLNQQTSELVGRGISVAVSDPTPTALPPAAQRANKGLVFDSSGNPSVGTIPSTGVISAAMAPVVSAATIAAAQALLGISAGLPSGIEADWPGLIAPAGWYFEFGQAIARAGDPNLLAAIAPTYSCTVTNGSATITGITSTLNWQVGMPIESSGFPPGTTVAGILSGSSVSASVVATGNAGTIQVFPYGNGDGATTFNLPDGRGVVYAGLTTMGGSLGSFPITVAGSNLDGTQIGKAAGAQNQTLSTAQIPAHNHTINITDPGHKHGPGAGGNFIVDGGGVIANVAGNNQATAQTASATTGITAASVNTGGGTAHPNMQPTSMRNKIIKGG